MKASRIFSYRGKDIAARHATKCCLAAVMVVLLAISCDMAICRAQSPGDDVPGAEVLTRGPVHEAFAGMVTFNPEPGVVISKAPPDLIEEVPPEERPAGDNVSWIPGYWAWDDERSDFMWISGTWRSLPPGREWLAGYWAETTQGHQWISGYWADAAVRETTYLPPPPATVEVGPNIAAPSADYGWTPGCWIWYQGRYAWRPGYWAQGRADWDWIPAHYVWTPRGHIFVGGYWDYSVERRGILFAPVYFSSVVYARPGYHYSPSIVINLGVFNDHLFLRPRYHHYYFGDYYAPSYHQVGFYASFSFQSSRHGYDPFYSRQRWEHRGDRDWEHRTQASYQNRRDHENDRPPRTWAAQRNVRPDTTSSQRNRMPLATPINQLASIKDSPMQFQPVAREERQQLAQRGQEVQKSREQRRAIEASAVSPTVRAPGRSIEPTSQTPGRTAEPTARAPAPGRSIEPTIRTPGRSVEPTAQAPSPMEPTRVQAPRSPIVAKPANQLAKNHTPPQAQQAPEPDLKLQPKSRPPGRQPNANQSNPQPQPRKPESEKRPPPKPSEATPTPREQPVQPQPQPRAKESGANAPEQLQRNAKAAERAAQLESQQRANEATAKAQGELQRNARGSEAKAQQESEQKARGLEARTRQESEQRAKDVAGKAQEEAQRNARGLEAKAQQESERRARDAALQTAETSQRNAQVLEARARQESQQRADDAAVKAREGPQPNATGLENRAQQVSEPPLKRHPGVSEKGATKLLRNDARKEGKGRPSPPQHPPVP